MTRCEVCKTTEFVDRLAKMCEKDPHTYSEMRMIAEYFENHGEISRLSGGAVVHLMRETDPEVEAIALETLGSQCSHGNLATAKQVKTILSNIRERIPTKGGDHQGAKKGRISNDLSGIYRPPIQPPISEISPNEDVVEEEEVIVEGDDNDKTIIPDVEVDDFETIPTMPGMAPQGDMAVVEEDEEIEEETKKSQGEVEPEDRERLERLKVMEEQRADEEAEKIVVTCLKSILRRGYPGHKLNWVVLRAVSDVLVPDRGCEGKLGSLATLDRGGLKGGI